MPRLKAFVSKGILSEAAVRALGAKNIHSVEDLLFLTCSNFNDVVARTGLPESELQEIVRRLLRELGSIPQCASEVSANWRAGCDILATGSRQLNDLLSGGFFTGEISELVGPCASGKTQVCLSLAVQTCRSNKNSGLCPSLAVQTCRLQAAPDPCLTPA
jgi:hypothetical protein